MAAQTVQVPIVAGITPAYGAAAASDTFAPRGSGKHILHVKNGGGSPDSVVINDPTSSDPGSATSHNPDVTVSVPAGQERVILIDPARFTNPANGLVEYTHSFTTSVTQAVHYVA